MVTIKVKVKFSAKMKENIQHTDIEQDWVCVK